MAMCHLKVMEEHHATAARELELVNYPVQRNAYWAVWSCK